MEQSASNIFEQASRLKLRFDTAVGVISVEDLWDLPLTSNSGRANLDELAQELSRSVKNQATESFVEKPPKVSSELQLQFDVVKHIIDVKLEEREAKKTLAERKEKKEKILAAIARKQDEKLTSASMEELETELASL
jgi:hypothetical protein